MDEPPAHEASERQPQPHEPDLDRPGDPFPRDRAVAVVRRLPAYGRLAWNVARDPDLPMVRRGAVMAAAAYLVSPLDAIPGLIPFVGQLDDVLVVMLAVRFALAGLSSERRQRHLAAVGLSESVLGSDLRSLGEISAWLVRAGGRAVLRASERGLRMSERGFRASDRGRRAVERAAQVREGRLQATEGLRTRARELGTQGVQRVRGVLGRDA